MINRRAFLSLGTLPLLAAVPAVASPLPKYRKVWTARAEARAVVELFENRVMYERVHEAGYIDADGHITWLRSPIMKQSE